MIGFSINFFQPPDSILLWTVDCIWLLGASRRATHWNRFIIQMTRARALLFKFSNVIAAKGG